jgi:hypothetical protein
MSVVHRRLGLLLCVAALLNGKLSDAGENAPSTSTFSATEIAPPAVDIRSIALPGKRTAVIPESWLDIDNPHDRSGFAGPSILRNVSQASITPFLPEKGKATGAAVIVAPGGGGVELSIETGGHGFAVNKSGKGSDQWLGLFEHWLREHDFAQIKRRNCESPPPEFPGAHDPSAVVVPRR